MGIDTVEVDGKTCPVVTCDGCGGRIKPATDGMVLYRRWSRYLSSVPERPAFEIRHKFTCDPDDGRGWEELNYFLAYLADNCGAERPPERSLELMQLI